jgi:hypothetical protein
LDGILGPKAAPCNADCNHRQWYRLQAPTARLTTGRPLPLTHAWTGPGNVERGTWGSGSWAQRGPARHITQRTANILPQLQSCCVIHHHAHTTQPPPHSSSAQPSSSPVMRQRSERPQPTFSTWLNIALTSREGAAVDSNPKEDPAEAPPRMPGEGELTACTGPRATCVATRTHIHTTPEQPQPHAA